MKMNLTPKGKSSTKEVQKPFLTGNAFDERTLKGSLAFFGTMLVVILVAFIACASAAFDSFLLRVLLNGAAIILALVIFFNSGSKRGTDDVTRGEILWQKQEKGREFSPSEQKLCFHTAKGYIIALTGTVPFIVLAVILALRTSVQMTGSGTLPSWMQAYTGRSEIGAALVNYTQPEGMQIIDYIRALVRIMILPFINITGSGNKEAIVTIERLSPLILLLPAVAYGTGYLGGRKVRAQIHTAISENDKKRIRKEQKRRKARAAATRSNEPEKLN